ncbi:hypothetical protein [Boudabousia marimammalium]|uniref:Solute-binding protein family 5 domain-containing protein n=1 Tax=Boudabousia marimammalium TaxID=156892 RepID=A0A1Q5PS82_9ACTO|nr:hypothetical protein [Boudabousia marimammalium]OKL50292.1 hypothetical protein BM477_02575 [Boudabousia marimammalium]
MGATNEVTILDPAESYDNGTFYVAIQALAFLCNSPYGEPEVKPDLAESDEFNAPTEFTVKLREGLKFTNGQDLSLLLYNLESVDAVDDNTVVFHL